MKEKKIIVCRVIDNEGFYTGIDKEFLAGEYIDSKVYIRQNWIEPLHKPLFDFESLSWIEGATNNELIINDQLRNAYQRIDRAERLMEAVIRCRKNGEMFKSILIDIIRIEKKIIKELENTL